MLVNLFGIKEVNYTSKRTGNPVSGTELHIVYHDDRVKGQAVDKLFIRSSVKLPVLTLGKSYNISFDRYGSVEFVGLAD